MQKAGRILLLVMTLLAISAATHNAEAQSLTDSGLLNVNIGSSTFISTPKHTNSKPKPTLKPVSHVVPRIAQVYASDTVIQPAILEPTATPTATTAPTPPLASLDANKIFDLVNSYRTSQGLPAFEKNDEVCQLAQVRSGELIQEAINGTIHSGLYNRNLPYWIWENAKYGSDEAGTVAWWIASPLHRRSILGDYKYSCVATSGNYVSELFTSFVQKK